MNSAYQYDQLGRLTTVTGLSGGKSQSYAYDGWGNLSSKTGDGRNFSLFIEPGSNRLTDHKEGAGICYDPNGNLTGVNGCDVDYSYDMSNRLVRVGSLGSPERYWYTADNKRVTTLKPGNGTLTQVFFIYGAKGESTLCSSQTFGAAPTCVSTELKWAGRIIRQAFNQYGAAPVVTDRVGSVVSKGVGVSANGGSFQSVLPYGDAPAVTSAPETGQSGFATYWSDTNTGLSYADQRYYNSGFGRFMSADPYINSAGTTDPGSWNRYSYVVNDPINRTDITGTQVDGENNGCGYDSLSPLCSSVDGSTPAGGYSGPGSAGISGGGCFLDGVSTDCTFIDALARAGGLAIQNPATSGGAAGQTNGQPDCTSTILSAVNSQFGTSFSSTDVQSTFVNGGAFNLVITGTGLSAEQFNSIQLGRFPDGILGMLIGYGPSLHIAGPAPLDPSAVFDNSNIGGTTSVTFTAHIDSAYAYNPIGAVLHYLIDVRGQATRSPCP